MQDAILRSASPTGASRRGVAAIASTDAAVSAGLAPAAVTATELRDLMLRIPGIEH